VSNPDLPGSYWQDQDEAYGSGRRARSAGAGRADRWADPRDGGSNGGSRGSWQAQYGNGNGAPGGRPAGNGHSRPAGNGHAAGNGRAAGNGGRGEAQTWTGIIAGRSRGSHAQRPAENAGGNDWTGRLSQTADDLRNRLGLRGSGSRRGNPAWSEAAGDRGQNGYTGGSRTALRQPDTNWPAGDRTGRLSDARTALRTRYGGAGGMGGGSGRGGGRGGRWDGRRPPGGPGGRHWTVEKVLGVLGACIAGVILLMVGAFFYMYERTSVPTVADLTANWQSSIVYYQNANGTPGQQMGHFDSNENGISVDRMQLNAGQIPPVMGQAMAAAEDRHFYTEGGVSLTGLMRAAYQDVFGHGNLQGGSTITMQYAKNYFQGVNTGQNLSTKLKEIIIAMKLGHSRSKTWVMTNYLNLVPFGPPQDTGLGAAAENYFNVNLSNGQTLNLEQAAMLASLPNSPGFFNPNPSAGAGYTALVARYKSVLLNMYRDGSITQQQEKYAAAHFPVLNVPTSGNGWTGATGYLMSMVEQQLEAPTSVGGYGLTKHQVETGGYRIYTTFRPDMEAALYQAVNKEIDAMRAAGAPFQSYDRIGSVLEDPNTGAIWAVYGGPGYGTPNCNVTNCQFNYAEAAEPVGSSFKPYVLSEAVNEGMNVFTSQLDAFSPIYIPVRNSPLNYSTLETTPSSMDPPQGAPNNPANASTYYDSSSNIAYFTFNEPSENSGQPLPVNVAAAISSDPAFEDLAHRDGIQNVINMAQAFGVGENAFVLPCSVAGSDSGNQAQIIQDCNDLTGPVNGLQANFGTSEGGATPSKKDTGGSVTIALGQNTLTPVEQASTFATLADDGLYHTPHVIANLVQNSGDAVPPHIIAKQVLSTAAAADVDYALSFDNNMSGATGEANVWFRRGGVIGKTGTLGSGENSSQAWFIGSTPKQAALSVALFTNDPANQFLNNMASVGGMPGSQGGGWPATIWNSFMTQVYGNTPAYPGGIFQQQQSQNGFATWQQAQAGQQNCTQQQWLQGLAQGQTPQCTCPKHAKWCSTQPGPGGQGGNGNPNPNPTPSPSQTCQLPAPLCPTPTTGTTAAFFYGSSPVSGSLPPLGWSVLLAAEEAAITRPTAVT
jgi:membrane peptidoglycan carboxypeptidase